MIFNLINLMTMTIGNSGCVSSCKPTEGNNNHDGGSGLVAIEVISTDCGADNSCGSIGRDLTLVVKARAGADGGGHGPAETKERFDKNIN